MEFMHKWRESRLWLCGHDGDAAIEGVDARGGGEVRGEGEGGAKGVAWLSKGAWVVVIDVVNACTAIPANARRKSAHAADAEKAEARARSILGMRIELWLSCF